MEQLALHVKRDIIIIQLIAQLAHTDAVHVLMLLIAPHALLDIHLMEFNFIIILYFLNLDYLLIELPNWIIL